MLVYIGIIEKQIVVSEKDKITASCSLVAKLLDMPDKFMLTVFCGKDSNLEEQMSVKQFLDEKYPHAEAYFIDGGQDIYPYIFVAE